MHSAAGNMKSDVHRCTSPRSFSVLVDFQCCVRNRRGLEGTVGNCFLFVCLLNNEFFVVIMFEDNNRTLRVLPRYNKTIVASCDWVHGFVHPRGENGTLSFTLWCHFSSRAYKTPWTLSQRASTMAAQRGG